MNNTLPPHCTEKWLCTLSYPHPHGLYRSFLRHKVLRKGELNKESTTPAGRAVDRKFPVVVLGYLLCEEESQSRTTRFNTDGVLRTDEFVEQEPLVFFRNADAIVLDRYDE